MDNIRAPINLTLKDKHNILKGTFSQAQIHLISISTEQQLINRLNETSLYPTLLCF